MKHYDIKIFNKLERGFEQEFIKYGKIVSFKTREMPFSVDELSSFFILY